MFCRAKKQSEKSSERRIRKHVYTRAVHGVSICWVWVVAVVEWVNRVLPSYGAIYELFRQPFNPAHLSLSKVAFSTHFLPASYYEICTGPNMGHLVVLALQSFTQHWEEARVYS